MYLLLGLFIGTLYGRNARAVNQRTYEDMQHLWIAFSRTAVALNMYLLADAIYDRIANIRQRDVVYTHDLLCNCNRRSCRQLSINTYVRKLKAIS